MDECLVLICDVCLVIGGGEVFATTLECDGDSVKLVLMTVMRWWLAVVRMG